MAKFNEILWEYYATHGRHDLPWRQPAVDGSFDSYPILVSEIMLQQTQVNRVIPKFNEFLRQFPSVQSLAAAALAEVLKQWSGLGYNRRAKFLWQAAQQIAANEGRFPRSVDGLVALPGVGKNTAGAIMAYACNEPVVFVETNIRSVYIHHFFADEHNVPDAAIAELLAQTLDSERPREFYWALMDYGSYVKQTVGNVSRYAKSYTKQSKFEGSRRQIRGQVLRLLAAGALTPAQLVERITDERLSAVVDDLVSERLIRRQNGRYML